MAKRQMHFLIDEADHRALAEVAQQNERTMGAEIRAAIRRSLTEFVADEAPASEEHVDARR